MVYLSEIDPSTSVACEIMKTFVDCYLIIKKNEINKYQSTIDCNKLVQIEEVFIVLYLILINKLIKFLKALLLVIKLLVLYKGYNFKEKLILHQLYLFLRGFYLKELYNIKMSLNANNLSHNGIMNSYLVIIYLNWSKIIDLIELNFFVKKRKKIFSNKI